MRLVRQILDARIADNAAINPGKIADERGYATVEELFFVSQPVNLAAGTSVSIEVILGCIPIAGRLDSLMFAATGATPSETGTNGWRFTVRRKRVGFSGAGSTKAVNSVDIQNVLYSKPWLAFEGVSLDIIPWVAAYTYANGAFFAPRDVLAVNISSVGTPVESIAGLVFTARVVPL